ncbi:hypothetical protein [Pirellula sp. SH-Sr6A]|uniref:hypothetical protein n=1 Tax=Pirellula sp. SH-Sr6A TaxID=1632865 RepID=UPI0011BA9554|nr:hypothetical protein [Pirellula sp. SH-Sr6A]
MVAGFSLLTGSANALWILLSLATIVTSFRLKDGELTFGRLGRRTRTVPLTDVVSTSLPTPQKQRLKAWNGATVWLRGGYTLFLSFSVLDNARVLATFLSELPVRSNDNIEGSLVRSAVASTMVAQALVTCLLIAIGTVALLILGVAFHPNPGVGDRRLFLALGCVLLSLCAIGFYFGVLRYWIGCVRWYRLDGRVLHYRTVLSSSISQRFVDELDSVASHRPTSQQAEAGSWRLLRFRDGEQLKLHVGILQNASTLYEELKALKTRNRIAKGRRPSSIFGSDHPMWQAIQPHLEEGEQVWWIGRPVYKKLWNEMAAEVVFGLIPGTIGLLAVIAGTTVFARRMDASLTLLVVGAFFTLIGFWCVSAPYRYRRMLQDTVYAVTSRRALVIAGFTWGPQVAVDKTTDRIQSITADKAMYYEVVGRGRDVVFGGEWRKGRKGRNYWGHHGFLAVDDRQGAEAALQCLLSSDETGC